jgi:DNA-binding response OmpR family regulator
LRRRETKVFFSTTDGNDAAAPDRPSAHDLARLRRRGRRTARTSVLLVHSDPAALTSVSDLLQRAGYRVRRAPSFEDARQALAARPACLVAAVQLGVFNGLHLVLDGRARDPRLAAIVVGSRRDEALRVDAQRLGAAYIVEPIEQGAFLALVAQLMAGAPVTDVPALYRDRRVADRRVVVLQFDPERRQMDRRRASRTLTAGV